MPEVEHSTTVAAPVGAVWKFVREMGNWAPFVRGYQEHRTLNAEDSVWSVKGELGTMKRRVELRVRITEWKEPDHVRFTLEGINEPVVGSGMFLVQGWSPATVPGSGATVSQTTWFEQIRDAIVRFFLRHIFRGTGFADTGRGAGDDAPQAQITFRLQLTAGGRAGPVINTLMEPLMKPVAEELANEIAAHVEELHRTN